MANVVPLAGEGTRFSSVGYILPKPLIPVSGKPMVLNAVRSMPKSNKWIFIVRKEHISQYQIDELIKTEVPHAIIIPVEKTTRGQAFTCMLAKEHLEENEPLFIGSCDCACAFNSGKYKQITENKDIDAITWTFTQNELLRSKPNAFGWVKVDKDELIVRDISVKKPVSRDPFNDHAVVSWFYFKKFADFKQAFNLMVKENHSISNEFYVDAIPIFLNKLGKKTIIFDADLFINWGSPETLYEYQEKEYLYRQNLLQDEKWVEYFKKTLK